MVTYKTNYNIGYKHELNRLSKCQLNQFENYSYYNVKLNKSVQLSKFMFIFYGFHREMDP